MVGRKIKQILPFLSGILAILIVAKCQVVETTWNRAGDVMAAKRSNYNAEISAEELFDFMKRWPEFNKLKIMNPNDLIEIRINDANVVTWKMRFWLVYRHWDAERFFYVYKRLLSLLIELDERREALNIIEQMKERKDDIAKQMIRFQKKRIKSQKITPDELLLLSANEAELRKMFKQYP